MRPRKVQDDVVINGILNVFRTHGYDGASLSQLAEGSGLQKASLYHRFNGGKKEIALAVLLHIDQGVQKNVHDLLADTSRSPEERLLLVLDNIREVYAGGQKTCVLRAMGMDSAASLFGKEIQGTMDKWIQGFVHLGRAFGFSETKALELAKKTLVMVQGSLIVSKGIGSFEVFEDALLDLSLIHI